MTTEQYKAAKIEIHEIEQEMLMNPECRKNVTKILRHDDLCREVHITEDLHRQQRERVGVR